jgi:hypothetical protein
VGNHGDAVLGQEFPDTQGRMAWRTVVVQKPGTGRPFVRTFLMNCILKALQNVSVGRQSDSWSGVGEEIRDAPDPLHQRK